MHCKVWDEITYPFLNFNGDPMYMDIRACTTTPRELLIHCPLGNLDEIVNKQFSS